ncbi:MAG: rhodanese-like domain-containing protein, partial [Terriglobales bacterium]
MMTDIEISVTEVAAQLAQSASFRLIDVRELWEFEQAHIAGAEHIPLAMIPGQLEEFMQAPGAAIVCYCHTGRRSLTAADWLRRTGVPGARSMSGGIDAW